MLAIGIVGIAGLRSPLKFSPLLFFQILEKLIWLIAIAAPRAIDGTLPTFAVILVGIYVPLTIGNFIAVPWKHIFAGASLENLTHPQHWLNILTPCFSLWILHSSTAFSKGMDTSLFIVACFQ